MRATINFKGELGDLLAKAKKMSGIENTSAVCNAALKEFVEREKARSLLMNLPGRAKLPKRRIPK